MASNSAMLHVRVDVEIKEQATVALEAMGLSMSEAVRLFLNRVVAEQAFPFELKVPNAATREAMAEAEHILDKRRARFASGDDLMADIEKSTGG